jgi:hypothetical protein
MAASGSETGFRTASRPEPRRGFGLRHRRMTCYRVEGRRAVTATAGRDWWISPTSGEFRSEAFGTAGGCLKENPAMSIGWLLFERLARSLRSRTGTVAWDGCAGEAKVVHVLK